MALRINVLSPLSWVLLQTSTESNTFWKARTWFSKGLHSDKTGFGLFISIIHPDTRSLTIKVQPCKMEDRPKGKTLLFIFSLFPHSFVPQPIFSSYYVSGAGDRLVPPLEKSLCCRRPIYKEHSVSCAGMLSRFSPVRLSNSTGRTSPFSSIHGIFPAKILEWVAMRSSRGSSRPIEPVSPTSPALQADFLPMRHQGSPVSIILASKS